MTTSSSLLPSELTFQNAGVEWLKVTPNSTKVILAGTGGSTLIVAGVNTPVDPTDAANKKYVDDNLNGLSWLAPVRLCSTVDIDLNDLFNNNISIDTKTIATGDRVLLSGQTTTPSQNGIYVVPAATTATPPRSADMPDGSFAASKAMFIEEGAAEGDKAFVCSTDPPDDEVGTDALVFVQFATISENLIAGTGIILDGVGGNEISILPPGAGLQFDATKHIEIKAAGVTNAMLVNDGFTLVTGDGMTGGAAVVLGGSTGTVAVDGTVLRVAGPWSPTGLWNFTDTTAASVGPIAAAVKLAGGLHVDKNIIATLGMTAASFTATSDRRKKEEIAYHDEQKYGGDPHALVRELRPASWRWIQGSPARDADGEVQAGVIAQDLEGVVPHALRRSADGMLSVNYQVLWTELLHSHQKLLQEYSALHGRVEALEQLALN